jgi:CubicO group peptidase (beta-lactamase class C family)
MLARAAVAVTTASVLLVGAAAPAAAQQGPVVGTPPTPDQLQGWGETYLDPDFWSDWVLDAIRDGHVNLPYPTDPVKPEAYLPNVRVADSDDYVSALPAQPRSWDGFTYDFGGESKSIEQFVRTTRTDVVVLVHDGRVVGEWYANGYGPDVRHQPWSVTKTYVAAVFGIAVDEGLVASVQDPVDTYLPELVGTEWGGVSLEDILQMESGVHWDEDTPVLAVNTQVEQWVQLALDLYSDGALGQTRNEFLASLPSMGYEPGTRFRYNSGNTQVLAWVLEELYDAPFNEVLSEKLWVPMGADGDAVMTADRVGSVVASHGLFARPYDFARFGELLRNDGVTPEGRRVLPEGWVDAMTTMTDVSEGRYGYQTWAHPIAAPDAYSASGFQGQKITVLPSSCVTGVRLSYALGADVREGDDPFDPDAYGFSTEFHSEEWQTLLRDVAAELGGCGTTAGAGGVGGGEDGTLAGAPDPEGDVAGAALPATGGDLPLLGLGLTVLATRLRRRR